MRKRYHYARQRAQLIRLSKQLASLRDAGRTITENQLSRFRGMFKYLAPRIGANNLRRALGTGAIMLGLAFGVQAQGAPNFIEGRAAPFGIVVDDDNSSYVQPVLADLDGDGDLDLIYGTYGDNYAVNYAYQENIGTPTAPDFGPRQINPFGLDMATDRITTQLVDLDGDGDLDVFEAGFNYGLTDVAPVGDPLIVYWENTGTATEPAFAAPQLNPWNLATPDVEINAIVASFGDLDGDGDLDLIAFSDTGENNEGSPRIYFYENNTPEGGAISFAAPVVSPFGITDVNIISRVPDVLADLDGDGDLDLFGSDIGPGPGPGGSYYTFASVFIENTGSATEPAFAAPVVGGSDGIDSLINEDAVVRNALADLDNDGDLDLLVTSDVEGFVYYRNGFPTSTGEERVNIDLSLSPNPTEGQTRIVTDRELSRVEVYDGLGRLLRSATGNVRNIDLSGLPAGTYTAKIVLPGNKFAVKRLVKK